MIVTPMLVLYHLSGVLYYVTLCSPVTLVKAAGPLTLGEWGVRF